MNYSLTDFSLNFEYRDSGSQNTVFQESRPVPLRAIPCHSVPYLFIDNLRIIIAVNLIKMATKYVQKVIPEVSAEPYKKLKGVERKRLALELYQKHCKGLVVRNKHVGIPIQLNNRGGKKTAYGEAVYYKKVAIISVLHILLEHAKYNNFGNRKRNESNDIIGYYNFKAYVLIDGKKECVRLAVRACTNGSFYYNVEVNK